MTRVQAAHALFGPDAKVHGSLDDKSCTAVDFQWCGAGYPARDVMYLVCSASCDKVRQRARESENHSCLAAQTEAHANRTALSRTPIQHRK
eukprot:616785-Rhodomonas_salina.2